MKTKITDKLDWLEQKTRTWSTQVSAGFIAEDIESAELTGFNDTSVAVVYSGHRQTIPLLSLNRREILELQRWALEHERSA
jgi:hypothetical protein